MLSALLFLLSPALAVDFALAAGTRGRFDTDLWMPTGVGGDIAVSPRPWLSVIAGAEARFTPGEALGLESSVAAVTHAADPSAPPVVFENDVWNVRAGAMLRTPSGTRLYGGPTGGAAVELRQVQLGELTATDDAVNAVMTSRHLQVGPWIAAGGLLGWGPHVALRLLVVDRIRTVAVGDDPRALIQDLGTQLDILCTF